MYLVRSHRYPLRDGTFTSREILQLSHVFIVSSTFIHNFINNRQAFQVLVLLKKIDFITNFIVECCSLMTSPNLYNPIG